MTKTTIDRRAVVEIGFLLRDNLEAVGDKYVYLGEMNDAEVAFLAQQKTGQEVTPKAVARIRAQTFGPLANDLEVRLSALEVEFRKRAVQLTNLETRVERMDKDLETLMDDQ